DLCDKIATQKSSASTLIIPARESQSGLAQLIQKYSGIVSLVPSEKISTSQTTGIDLPSLIDGLFRPASQNWRPFQENLDIRRVITDELLSILKNIQDQAVPNNPRLLLIRGEAGVGKTTLLKRLAVEIAQRDIITLWCSRATGRNWLRSFKDLASDLSEWIKKQDGIKPKFIVICDDPWALQINASDLIACFDRLSASIVFIFSMRNSDHVVDDFNNSFNTFIPDADIEIPYELVEEEISQLSTMLVRIGAAKDKDSAVLEIQRIPSKHAKDILCSLWYLVPETRTQLSESLRDEYCRLGTAKDVIHDIARNASSQHGLFAHSAYEFVTVTSNLNIGLPVEVLVHALGINYSEWLDIVGRGRPLWGLLYDVEDERTETFLYFTRNEVVTKVLLDLVNGGVGHAGEMRILKRLLSSCKVGSLVYRTFVLDVLVRGRKKLAEVLTYEQGLELFDIAREALPHEDRVIEHHKGVWMHDVGHDDKNAYRQFEYALHTEIYPGTDRDAPKEHIYTSMAASLVKLIREGKQNAEDGAAQVREHLRQATRPRYFDFYTSHVSANLLFDLANIDPSGIE
ncbi:MAG: NACHT domain-containing protein, partial [Bryobacterales bacterium]